MKRSDSPDIGLVKTNSSEIEMTEQSQPHNAFHVRVPQSEDAEKFEALYHLADYEETLKKNKSFSGRLKLCSIYSLRFIVHAFYPYAAALLIVLVTSLSFLSYIWRSETGDIVHAFRDSIGTGILMIAVTGVLSELRRWRQSLGPDTLSGTFAIYITDGRLGVWALLEFCLIVLVLVILMFVSVEIQTECLQQDAICAAVLDMMKGNLTLAK